MWISLPLGNCNINDATASELLDEEILGVDDCFAIIPCRVPHLLEFRFGLCGHRDDVTACSGDTFLERLELFEVGLAEGTPVAAVDCYMLERPGKWTKRETGHTDDEDEVRICANSVIALHRIGCGSNSHCQIDQLWMNICSRKVEEELGQEVFIRLEASS